MFFCLLYGCRHNSNVKTDSIAVIDIVRNLGKYKAIPLSDFVNELEYIPLEIGDDCLISEWDGGFSHIIVTSSHIFIAGNKYKFCYAFGRDGRFICKIGNFGQGPEEYQYIHGLSIDENKQSLYINALYSLIEYSYNGAFRRSFKMPQTQLQLQDHPSASEYTNRMNNVFFAHDNLFIGHTLNFMGNEKYNFQLINDSAQVVKSFRNYVQFNRTRVTIGNPNEVAMRPYRVSENIYVKEMPNDTVFCLNTQNELIPKFVFNLGQYAYSIKDREDPGMINPPQPPKVSQLKVIFVPYFPIPMVGSPNYVFFSYEARNLSGNYSFPEKYNPPPPVGVQNFIESDSKSHLGIYDIINQRTQLLDTDPVLRRRGLINDLDGGLPFWPKYYSSANELVDVWQANEMKEYLTDTYFTAHEIKDPQAHQKLKELLKHLDEEDNPVIVIATLKK